MGSFWCGTIPALIFATIHHQKNVGQIALLQGGMISRCCDTALTCAWKVCWCAKRTMRRNQAIGQTTWRYSWEMALFSEWTSPKVREQEDEDRQSIAEDILRKSTDFPRRTIVPVEGQGGVNTRLKTTSGEPLLDTERSGSIGGVLHAAASTIGSEQSLGQTRQHGPPRSKSVASVRCTTRSF